jgi:hypothetical protein
MDTVKTNDLKKGMWVMMRGTNWIAQIADNMRGNIRMAKVYGLYTEIGSVYVWDIRCKLADDTDPHNEERKFTPVANIELTPKQVKDRDRIQAMGF